jgi:hypothetical protein
MPWDVKYFVRADDSIPARDFQSDLPIKLRTKLLRITLEVAISDGALGGGFFEVCHAHPGLHEIRVRHQRDLARFVCTRDGDSLILLTGVLKVTGEATPEATFVEADGFLAEYRKTGHAV